MKRQALPRVSLARHEAGHIVASAMFGPLGSFSWLRLAQYEIAHAEPPLDAAGWEHARNRNSTIARRVIIALAGGAAECCATGAYMQTAFSAETVYAWTGAVDYELAHEWLALQRYDGDQAAIEADICRLFAEICEVLNKPRQRRALQVVANRILADLAVADEQGVCELRTSAEKFLDRVWLDAPPVFALGATLASSPDGPRGPPAA